MWYEDHEIRTFCTHKNDGDFRDRIDARLLFPCAYRIPFYIYLLNEIELSVLPSIFRFNKYFIPQLRYRPREVEKLVNFIFLMGRKNSNSTEKETRIFVKSVE